jgi:ABC-2 type transport system permease protein
MRSILTMISKEFKQVFRDRPMLVLIFMAPMIQLLILAHAMNMDVKHIKLSIINLDNSMESKELVRIFSHTDRFDVVDQTRNIASINDQFKSWKTEMALTIPPNFGRDLKRSLNPSIDISVDGVNGNSAGVALGYANAILSQFGLNWLMHPNHRKILKDVHQVTLAERMWYNIQLSSKQYMVPGIAVVLLTIIPMILSAMSLVREKEIGTLEQLMVTPLKKYQLLLGKLIPFLVLSFLELILLLAVSMLIFRIHMNGSYPLLAGLSFLYLFTTLGLGIFVSTITHTQQQAMFVSWFLMVFMILMSGFFIPIENMPLLLRELTYLNPMRYFMSIVRDVFQKGSPVRFLVADIIPMTVYGLSIFLFSVIKFRKRIG